MLNNESEFICDFMNYFMFNNNSMSENFKYLSTKYTISIYEWHGDLSKIVKRIKYKNKLNVEQTIIVSFSRSQCFRIS